MKRNTLAGVCLFGGWGRASRGGAGLVVGTIKATGFDGKRYLLWHHEVTVDWWGQGYKVIAGWQITKFEPKRCRNYKEANLGEAYI